ncbi:NYN domain-containing protein [Stutzerimonas balearica]|uniref:NYN domain-containing protein n=1 Tax=Stutzerimonas balearica TaxID=74829 RepID=UPI0028ABB1E5|nr:NYN domain-containing protein [Stutzerimonas balearica]
MNRLGIFVDAGYLFAQGSAVISGATEKRVNLSLNEQAVITQLIQTADELSGGTPLLRIYWYDAIGHSGPSLDQKRLAQSNNVKMRMGTLNGSGQQKGVDSMIVIDMIELARNHAIADAVLVSGDEDVRVGVQFAQSYGVRVHLLGIASETDKHNQSPTLVQEADTHIEWGPDIVNSFLALRQPQTRRPVKAMEFLGDLSTEAADAGATAAAIVERGDPEEIIVKMATAQVDGLVANDLQALKAALSVSSATLPREFDGKLLGMTRDALGRDLTQEEKRLARKTFKACVKRK